MQLLPDAEVTLLTKAKGEPSLKRKFAENPITIKSAYKAMESVFHQGPPQTCLQYGGLLQGADAKPDEIRLLAELFKVEQEELVSVLLYTRDSSVLCENLKYLVASIPHGKKETVAKAIGVTAPQFSRWAIGEITPHKKNLKRLLKLHGIDQDLDLTTVPLFLALDPLSGFDQREWVANRVRDLPAAEIARIYPALRKLLRYDE